MDRLTNLLLEMGDLSVQTVEMAMESYRTGKSLQEVNKSSNKLKMLDDQVSELAIELIARFQPVASDLRYIKACLEISYGFYRYGRYAKDIVEVLDMFGDPAKCDHAVVDASADKTKEMIRLSVEAFSKKDVDLARRITSMDDYVDNAYRDHIRKLMKSRRSRVAVRALRDPDPAIPREDRRSRDLHRQLRHLHREGRRAVPVRKELS